MSADPVLLPFNRPENPERSPAAPALTLGSVIGAYLAHLALELQLGQITRDYFVNVSHSLTSFAEAWRVVYGDGRQALLRASGAATPEAALAQAKALVGPAGSTAVQPLRNRDWPLAQAASDDLTRWVLANPQWKTGHTKSNNLNAIVGCFHWYEEETGTRAPYRRSRLPHFEKRARREADAREYVALMRHTSSTALRRVLWCLWNVQGIRTCEMRELTWVNFRSRSADGKANSAVLGDPAFCWDSAFILLDKHKTRKATGKPKLIGLTPRQLRFFAALYRQRPAKSEHVFLNTEGEAWSRRALSQHLRRTAKRIGLDEGVADRVSAYCLRHSFATQADEAGVDRAQTALLMGHSGPEMIERIYSKMAVKAQPVIEAAAAAERARQAKRRAGRKPKAKPPTDRPDQPLLFD